jgi:hypothetical protein
MKTIKPRSKRPFWRQRGIQINAAPHLYVYGFPTAKDSDEARKSVEKMLARFEQVEEVASGSPLDTVSD